MYYSTQKITERITCIRGAAGERCWLAEGERGAALIDSTCGHAGLDQVVAGLTAKPVQVLMTHGHRDHVGGAWAFGKAWLHPGDLPLVERACDSARRAEFARSRAPEGLQGELTARRFPAGPVEWLTLGEGQVFDLGGLALEVLEAPGHTAGSVCFWDRAGGTLFSGDICTRRTLMMLPESLSLEVLEGTLRRLQGILPQVEHHLIGHDPGTPGEGVLEQLLSCAADIRAGRDDHEPYASVSGTGWLSRRTCDPLQQLRADGKYGNIVYRGEMRGG